MSDLTVILPAHNEEAYLGDCLRALLASRGDLGAARVIVAANGCRDRTVEIARSFGPQVGGWRIDVLDLPQGGKMGALRAAEALIEGGHRLYLDADVIVSPDLVRAVVMALDRASGAAYVSGRPELAPARSWISRSYGRFWMALPFARSPAPGFGLFAVNDSGRQRWGDFPDLISDDTFVRLQFSPHERIEVNHSYRWPLVEGFAALVRVRRRQDAGVAQLHRLTPEIFAREAKASLGLRGVVSRALRDPVGFVSYAVVSLAVRAGPAPKDWTRGR